MTIFSTLILVVFFVLLSSNGLVLGNDPAVHLSRINMFLASGRIPLGDIAFYPPLYHILLTTFMAFTGATNVDQTMFLMKSITALIDWLIVFSVYLIGAKFFDKKTGVLASALMLLFFPFYEINFWGGYTTLLSLVFMFMLFLYLSLGRKGFVDSLLVFMLAFFLVLSHQLTAFLTFLILVPFVLVGFVRSRGRYSKVGIAAIFGGLLAFFLYYSQTILPNINGILQVHIFVEVRLMLNQASSTAPETFLVNFGFTLFFAAAGIVLAFFRCKEGKHLGLYLLLCLSFFVPLFFSQSYLVGLYLPYQRFLYYLLPPLAVFAAVCLSFIVNIVVTSYRNNKNGWKNLLLKAISVLIIVSLSVLVFYHLQGVFGKINESTQYYSTTDLNGYNAGIWMRNNFPGASTVVVTEKPGSWFGVFSGKFVIAKTDPASGRNNEAETVLDLAYEAQNPLTMVRAYESKGNVSDENYISINELWRRVTSFLEWDAYVSFSEKDGTPRQFALSSLSREIVLEQGAPQRLIVKFSNDEVVLTEAFGVRNDSYSVNVSWTLSSLKGDIDNVVLQVNDHFDLYFKFKQAYVPGVLDWESPWNKPSYVQEKQEWAFTEFSRANLTDDYIGVYDATNQAVFALKFADLPDSGAVGVLASGQIDKVVLDYRLGQIGLGQSASVSYQLLTFAQSSVTETGRIDQLKDMFDFKPTSALDLEFRSYVDYIRKDKIDFLVYSTKEFDPEVLGSGKLLLVYSNDGYVICRVKQAEL